MDWRLNENSLFAILLRSPWWIAAIACATPRCNDAVALLVGEALLVAHHRPRSW
jgi:hypothetical protein